MANCPEPAGWIRQSPANTRIPLCTVLSEGGETAFIGEMQKPLCRICIAAVLLFPGVRAIAQLPEGILDTQDPATSPPTPEESLEMISVPEGFSVSLFAGEPNIAQPIAIQYDDRGRLWAIESFSYIEWARKGQDRILIFEDTDNDGTFDSRKVFWEKGNHLSGFQVGYGGVWVCDAPELLFIPDSDGDDIPDGEPRVVLDGWALDAEHNFFNGLTWGPDGWLWGRHGIKKPSHVGKPGTPEKDRIELSCCIWRVHPITHDFEIVADGTINPWGLDWNAEGQPFINTSVIDHFWHLVPGARFERWADRGMTHPNPFTYEQMKPTSDHRHWFGGQKERKTYEGAGHEDLGGGHSHCGMVIYQADAWPEEYRGKAFFSNVLGQRINMDHIERSHSGYVASHGEDFLTSSSEWFRAVDLKQGPYGEMMVAEWTDLGECHDRDGIHRTSGRLYEVWYGDRAEKSEFNVSKRETEELVDLLFHENSWWRRHALRNLYERSAAGEEFPRSLVEELIGEAKETNVRDAVSAVDGIHAMLGGTGDWIFDLYAEAKAEEVRAHLVNLAFSSRTTDDETVTWLEKNVGTESGPLVHLAMASALQRVPVEKRWSIAEELSRKSIPPEDENLVLMIWYGMEPAVVSNAEAALELARSGIPPFLSEAIARRLVSGNRLNDVLTSLSLEQNGNNTIPVLQGILAELPASAEMPEAWPDTFAILESNPNREIQDAAFELALLFGDEEAEKKLIETVVSSKSNVERVRVLNLLTGTKSKLLGKRIWELIDDPVIGTEAIRSIPAYPGKNTAKRLLSEFHQTESSEKRTAILQALASRKELASVLVRGLKAGEIDKSLVPTYIARQLIDVSPKKEREDLEEFWGFNNDGQEQKEALLAIWKDRLPESNIAKADAAKGKLVYQRACSACHQMFGEGGVIGPNLTGSNRANLDYFLLNVLFPSEDVGEDYRLVTLSLKDGRTLVGNVVEENEKVITFREITQTTRIDKSDVKSRQVAEASLMPPGLLDTMTIEEVTDLVAYLRTTGPIDSVVAQ